MMNRPKRKYLWIALASLFICFGQAATAQLLNPVKWSFHSKRISAAEAEVYFRATIDNDWHLYSQHIPQGDVRPVPTSFEITPDPAFNAIGQPAEPKGETHYDENFMMDIKMFDKTATFTQKIKLTNPATKAFQVKGALEFMCCSGMQCLPPETVEFDISVEAFTAGAASQAQATATATEQPPPSTPVAEADEVTAAAAEQAGPETAAGNLAPETGSKPDPPDHSLWHFFIIALLAGFAGSLTPCVYPMIPMTVTYFMKSSGHPTRGRVNALAYGFFIIIIYTVIGVLVTILFGSDAIRSVSNHWLTNLIFFALFVFFALSLFGMFELVLPASLTNKTDQKADKGGLVGTFFMALTLVLVSFSCTAPFVGGILVEAASGSMLMPTVGMFGFSLAFALPFTFFAFFPALMNKLPRSGGWMSTVKAVLGFLVIAFGTKFLLAPNQELGWQLTREVFLAFWIVLFTMLGIYVMGGYRFKNDSAVTHVNTGRLVVAFASFSFAIYLFTGFLGARLDNISGFIPTESSIIKMQVTAPGTSRPQGNLCEEPKYADKLTAAAGLQAYFDYDQGLACAKALNKPVLLYFKGHACANCKVMEKKVFSEPEVQSFIAGSFVFVALYTDDKTPLPENEWYTSTFNGKTVKTLGKKNLDIQINGFNSNAQPYFVVLTPEGVQLKESIGFTQDKSAFIDYLTDVK